MSKSDFQHCYQFNHGEWEQLEEKQCLSEFSCQQHLKVGMYNILWGMSNKLINRFARSNKRFDYILNKLIPSCDADILSLMEVSEEFITILLNNTHIRNTYYVSHIQKMRKDYVHEVFIISKQPFSTIFMNDDHYGRCMFSVFANKQEEWKSFIISTAHLWAYEDDHKRRSKQMQLINVALKTETFLECLSIPTFTKRIAKQANRLNNVILQGDLNLHLRYEDSFIYENEFLDVWKEVYPDKDGYTWDSLTNSLIKSIYIFDNRRMRLDRILLRQRSNLFQIQDIEIRAKESIGYRLNCSDHYLLLSHLKINSKPQEIVQKYDTNQINMEWNTGFRSFTTIVKIRIIISILLLLFIGGAATGLPLTLKK